MPGGPENGLTERDLGIENKYGAEDRIAGDPRNLTTEQDDAVSTLLAGTKTETAGDSIKPDELPLSPAEEESARKLIPSKMPDAEAAPEPGAIDAARADIDARYQVEQGAKNAAIENYQKAQADLDNFRKARDVMMRIGTPDSLKNDIANIQAKIEKLDGEIAKQPPRKQGFFDRLRGKPVNTEKTLEETKKDGLKAELDKKMASMDQSKEAYRDFGGKREDILMRAVTEAKQEAEKH